MSLTELPVIDRPRREAVDLPALQRALAEAISTHDVRADRLNRALYATDASVYQIVPLMVAFPATAADVSAAVRVCARFGVPITARGGGTSQAGQSIGPGVILDCSKHLDRIVEINAEERWARVQPGCVLDDLNRALKPHGLLFAPDISTSNRATIGGMIANNSSGARSVFYGKTIDHVLELDVVLSDGSLVHLGPIDESEVEARCAARRPRRRLLPRRRDGWRPSTPTRSSADSRRSSGASAATTSTSSCRADGTAPRPIRFNLARMFIGSEGTLGLTVEAKLKLVELAPRRATLVVEFADLLEALAATPMILRHRPAAVEVVDKYVLDSTRLNPEATRLRDFLQGDPAAILLIELYGDRADELPPRLAALEDDLQRDGFGYHHLAHHRRRRAGAGLEAAHDGAGAVDGREGGRQGDLVRRGHGRRARAPARLHRRVPGDHRAARDHGGGLRACLGRLPARPAGDQPQDRGGRAAVRGDRRGGRRAGAQVRRCALGRARRRPGPRPVPGEDVRPGALCRVPRAEAHVRPAQPPEPRQDRRCPAAGDEPAVRPELCRLRRCRRRSTSRPTAACCRPPSCARASGPAGSGPRGRCARRSRRPARRRTARAAGPTCCGSRSPASSASAGFTDPHVHEVLDLCLECKACKGECPTNVDMARLKAEFLHQYFREHGVPLRNRFFGHVAELARIGGALAPLSSWLAQADRRGG